jgi:hypothetical protein
LPQEEPREVALIVEAARIGHRCQRDVGAEQASGASEPLLDDIRVWRKANVTSKRAEQLVSAEARLLGKLGERDRRRRIRIDARTSAANSGGSTVLPRQTPRSMSTEVSRQTQKGRLGTHRAVGRNAHRGKCSVEALAHRHICKDGHRERKLLNWLLEDVLIERLQGRWLKVEHAPRSTVLVTRASVVDLPWIDTNEISRSGVDRTTSTE